MLVTPFHYSFMIHFHLFFFIKVAIFSDVISVSSSHGFKGKDIKITRILYGRYFILKKVIIFETITNQLKYN